MAFQQEILRRVSGSGQTESLPGLKQAKCFLQGPSVKRTKELLKLNRNQLWWVTGPFAGHCHLKGHLFKMGLTISPICKRCLEKEANQPHTSCVANVCLRFHDLGHYFMERRDYHDTPVSKIQFIWNVGLLKGWNRRGWTIDHWRSWCKGQSSPTPYAFIHCWASLTHGIL